MAKPHDPALCPRFHYAVELIGRRWSGAILYLLLREPTCFSTLREGIAGITDPMLSARLHELEAEGVVERRVLGGAPVRVQYSLTAKGRALGEVMGAIGDWSHRWVSAAATHAKRGAKPPARRTTPRKPPAERPPRRRVAR